MKRMNLETELALYGIDMTPEEFEGMLHEKATAMFPSHTAEQIMYRPTEEAVPLCEEINRSARRCVIPEEFILRRLVNLRKFQRAAAQPE